MAGDEGLDQVLAEIGYGLWQLPVLILTILVHLVVPVHMLGSALLSAPVDFRCSPITSPVYIAHNISLLSFTNLTTFIDDNSILSSTYNSKCLDTSNYTLHPGLPEYAGFHNNITGSISGVHTGNVTGHYTGLISCPWVSYDTSVFTSTVISEWDLICEKEVLRPLFQMMYSIGALFGSCLGGQISDSFGRKRAVQVASIINVSAVLLMYTMPWYTGLLITRIFIGGTCNFMILPAYSLALETIPPKYRTMAGMLLGTAFSVGIIIFAGLGYFIRTWRHLMLLAASVPFVLIIPLSFYIYESPRWLFQNGDGEEGFRVMKTAAVKNKVTLCQRQIYNLEQIREKSTVNTSKSLQDLPLEPLSIRFKAALHGIWAYFRSAPMRVIMIVTPLIWILQGCLYLGIILNANNFTSNNPFVYITMSGVMDLSSILLATPLNIKLGRRVLICCPFFIAGVFLMINLAVTEEYLWLKWILVMTSLMLVAGSFQVNFLYVPELFPTVIRARGFALANLALNVGFFIAPLITDILAQVAPWAVSVTFGSAGILASLLVPLLPETNNRPLPDTILDVEKRQLNNKQKKEENKKKNKKNTTHLEEENDEEAPEECVALTPS